MACDDSNEGEKKVRIRMKSKHSFLHYIIKPLAMNLLWKIVKNIIKPLVPIFAGLSALVTLMGGASEVTKTTLDAKNARHWKNNTGIIKQ